MSFSLTDLNVIGRQVLRALADLRVGTRGEIAGHASLTKQQTSSALNRLENFALVQQSAVQGGPWTITAEGDALLAGEALTDHQPRRALLAAAPNSAPAPALAAEPEPEPAVTEVAGEEVPGEDWIPTELEPTPDVLLRAREVEDALALVRLRLRCSLLPASSVKVYRDLVASLPPVLREELLPITQLIASG